MPEIHDLRSFINCLEDAGQLVRITRPVDLEYELADLAAALERRRRPAPLFEAVRGSDWPIFASAVASQARAALALGCERGEVVRVMSHALDPANGIPPVRLEQAAWKDNVVTGDDVDVRKLPIPTHAVGDGGPFITLPLVHTTHPVDGTGNLGMYRLQRFDSRSTGMHWQIEKGGGFHFHQSAALNRPLPVSVILGGPPALIAAAVAPLPEGIDERLLAAYMMNRPLDRMSIVIAVIAALAGERPGSCMIPVPSLMVDV